VPAADGVGPVLRETLRALLGPRRAALVAGALLAAALMVPDFLRQLPVRDDPSRIDALLVDLLGVLTATIGQVALVGALVGALGGAPARRWLARGVELVLRAARRRPAALLAGLVAAGAVSAVLTLPVSIAALGLGQVIGPLRDPSLGTLGVATLSDAVATAVTAPYFALLAGRLGGAR